MTLTALSALDAWRLAHFGNTANSSTAADTADHNGDGEVNLLEFATGQNPGAATRRTPSLLRNGASLEFTYTRAKAALADGIVFTVKWSDTLAAGSWSSAGVTEEILSDNGTLQTVRASVASGVNRRFLLLEISRP